MIKEFQFLNRHIAQLLNLLLTIVGAFIFGYFIGQFLSD